MDAPELAICSQSGRKVPRSCLAKCEITGAEALQHLLGKSDVSSRLALPKFILVCALSNKRVLKDEVAEPTVSGRLIAEKFLKTSEVSRKRAEPEYFGRCHFTDSEVLKTELKTSEISGKPYRIDHETRSAISGKAGHRQEFTNCHVTGQPIAKIEAEACEVTGQQVRPGILEICTVSGKHALPSELADGIRRTADEGHIWEDVRARIVATLGSTKCRVEAAVLSPTKQHLAFCTEIRTFFGVRVRHAGSIFSLVSREVIGRLVQGKRSPRGWIADQI